MTDRNMLAEPSAFFVHLDQAIDRLKARARRARLAYNAGRAILIIGSAALPALTALGCKIAATIVAIIVAASAGLDAQFQPGELWRHNRSYQRAAERRKLAYEYREMGSPSDEAVAFTKLFEDVETLLKEESDSYFPLRVTKWKEGVTRNEVS